jgi:hypothetical protein
MKPKENIKVEPRIQCVYDAILKYPDLSPKELEEKTGYYEVVIERVRKTYFI